MPTLNYTTTIAAAKTLGEMQVLLAKHGAGTVAIHYEDGRAGGLSFTLITPHGVRAFTLPVNVPAVLRLLERQRRTRQIRPGLVSPEQAERVAWRVSKDWLAAQLALVEAEMATIDQVMLPYLHVDGDERTLYQRFAEREQLAIEAAS